MTDNINRKQRIKELKNKKKFNETKSKLEKHCPGLSFEFFDVIKTNTLEEKLWETISDQPIIEQFSTCKIKVVNIINQLKPSLENMDIGDVLLLHEDSTEIGAIILSINSLFSYLEGILDFISYEKREHILTGGLVIVSKDLKLGICILHDEYEDSFVMWGIERK